MHCGLRDVRLTEDHKFEPVFKEATSAPLDPGQGDVASGNSAWLFYHNKDFTVQNSLFCRRVQKDQRFCTKIYYR